MPEHNTNDYLEILSEQDNSLGRLVNEFLKQPQTFIQNWINSEAQKFINEKENYNEDSIILDGIEHIQNKKVKPFKIINLELSNFRGVRDYQQINFSSPITIVTGESSTGKTTIAEAIEWLLTGKLSRYQSNTTGEAAELKNCIRNHKATNTETYVQLRIDVQGENYTLKRILIEDYSGRQNSICQTKLFQDRKETNDENSILRQLIVTTPPVLFQHSIGDFIKSKQSDRAVYFESLLGIETLTDLIAKLVVSDEQLNSIKNEYTQNYFIETASKVIKYNPNSNLKEIFNVRNKCVCDVAELILSDLISNEKFSSLDKDEEHHIILEKAKSILSNFLLKELPMETLVPQKELSLYFSTMNDKNENLTTSIEKLKQIDTQYFLIKDSLKTVDEQSEILYKAIVELQEKGIIDTHRESQKCPLCGSEDALVKNRIDNILSTAAIQEQIQKIEKAFVDELYHIKTTVESKYSDLRSFLPKNHNYKLNIEYSYSDENIKKLVEKVNIVLAVAWAKFIEMEKNVFTLKNLIDDTKDNKKIQNIKILLDELQKFTEQKNAVYATIQTYHSAYVAINDYIKQKSLSDAETANINNLFTLLENEQELALDVEWHYSKQKISDLLKKHRETLKQYRTKIFKSKETFLNEGLKNFWLMFRPEDLNQTTFNKINLPEPSGRGYQAKIEVIADVMDKSGGENTEVSALSVFTESQTSLLGLAAFITKCNIEGHQLYVLDDPMQSMSEDHMEKFASEFIDFVERENLQLIVFTHSKTFSKTVSEKRQFEPYIKEYTSSCTKKYGSRYSLSDNYIMNNLESIRTLIEDGQQTQIKAACTIMRSKVLEKLFKLILAKETKCPYSSIYNDTLESMLKKGVRNFFNNKIPKYADEMNELCNFLNSSDGPHDAEERTPQVLLNRYKLLVEIVNQVKKVLEE